MKLAMKHPDVFSSVYAHSAGRLDMETWLELDKDSILKAIDIQTWDPKSISPYLMVIISELSVFAPNPDSPPFFGDFPLTPSGEKVDAIWQKYMAHDPLTMIPLYENNLRQLRAIAFDNGSQEEDNVIRKNFSVALALQGIEHQFETFEGNHSNHTVEQMKLKIIPFFSENLDHAR
jgi:S-formylglutathione hydrolase FrmB